MRPLLALLSIFALGCADPSEVQALRARKAALESALVTQRQLLADEALYRSALKQAPLAGTPLDPPEVTARVTRATSGVSRCLPTE